MYWNEVAWRYTISTVQAIGPVAVKFCQWVATRRDVFPPHICDRLAVLHDRGYHHSWDYTDQVLTEAFGDYKDQGLTVEEVIGCGSAAQVYKGSLEELDSKSGVMSKRQVAIKVLHPNFSWSVDRDFALMQSVADFIHSLPSDAIRMVNLPRATENFGHVLRLQADLTNEANNLKQFRTNFYKNNANKEKNSTISFPQPIPGWANPRVLVEDYVQDAIPISTYLQDSTPDGVDLRRELAAPLLRAFLKMVFVSSLRFRVLFCVHWIGFSDSLSLSPSSS
jgi:aarF domain-containing kinase